MAGSLATLAIQGHVGKGNTQLIQARDSKRAWYAFIYPFTQAIGGGKMRITTCKLRLIINNNAKGLLKRRIERVENPSNLIWV